MKKKLILILGLVLLPVQAWGAAASESYLMGDDTGGEAITEDTNGDTLCIFEEPFEEFIIYENADFVSGSSTADVSVQYSTDSGTTWFTLESFTQVTTADDTEAIHIQNAWVPKCLRAVVDVGSSGSPVYNITVKVLYRRAK